MRRRAAIYGGRDNAVRCRCSGGDYTDKGILPLSPYCGSGLYVSVGCLGLIRVTRTVKERRGMFKVRGNRRSDASNNPSFVGGTKKDFVGVNIDSHYLQQ